MLSKVIKLMGNSEAARFVLRSLKVSN